MAKFMRFVALTAFLGVIGAAVFVLTSPRDRSGSSFGGLDQWIGRQIIGLVNTFLVPQISFESLKYTPPATVDLAGVALTAPDGTRVVELQALTIQLAEVPRIGQPLVIEQVAIRRGQLNVIADPATGTIRGLMPLVRQTSDTTFTPEGEPTQQFKLSEVLRFRRIELDQVGIFFDPGNDMPTMTLAGISTVLKIDPPRPDEPAGWYALDVDLQRPPLFELAVTGRLNLDDLVAEVSDGRLTVDVNESTLPSLPPEIQKILKDFDAHGHLRITFSGAAPLRDALAGQADAKVAMKNFSIAAGEYQLPIDELNLHAGLSERRVVLHALDARVLDGTLKASGSLQPAAEGIPAELNWNVENVELARAMRVASPDARQQLSGKAFSHGSATTSLQNVQGTLSGSGTAAIRNGKLLALPIVSELSKVMKIMPMLSKLEPKDRADATFRLEPAAVRLEQFELVTTFLAARGRGMVTYDGQLDLRVNAGGIERIKNLLGEVGGIFNKLTDKLVSYRVTGPVAKPKVSIAVLDGG